MKHIPRRRRTLAMLVLCIILVGFPVRAIPAGQEPAQTGATSDSSLISTALPARRSFTRTIPWIGRVETKISVQLTAQMDGRIMTIEVADQSPVTAGQAVARLGGPQIEATRAGFQEQVSTLTRLGDLNRQTLDRLKEGLRDQLATKDQLAVAEVDQLKLERQLHQARLDLENFEAQAKIRAPASGIFTSRRVVVGAEVRSGGVIGTLIDPAHLQIVAALFPPPAINLKDRAVVVRLDETKTLAGRVAAILPETTETGATQVWIEGPELNQELRPGQTVSGSLVLAQGAETLSVPESAIVYDDQDRPCLFIAADGSYALRQVEVGLSQDGWIEVLSGLAPDQQVVTRGAYELFYRQFNQQFKVPD